MTQAPAPADPAKKNSSKLPLIIGGVIVLGALGGGGGWYFHHRSVAAAEAKPVEAASDPTTEVKSVVHLESFVVNLQGGSDNGYLRVGIDLGVAAEQKEGEKGPPATGKLRDTILTVLGTRGVDELLTADGKAKLKTDLLKAIQDKVPEIECREVYFTEFLVQH